MTAINVLTSASSDAADDDALYEIIDGNRVELPPMSAYAALIATRLATLLNVFANPRNLGEAVMEALFKLPLPVNRSRRPDVAFVPSERWPKGRPRNVEDNAFDVVPSLAVEVVSPTNTADEIQEKIKEYFQAGVLLVWVVYPRQGTVHVYESATKVRGIGQDEILDGGAVLPGFQLALKMLIPEEPES